MACRWWPISGICSSSDSWYPTSLPLITAAWVWWTESLSGEDTTREMSHGPMTPPPKAQILPLTNENYFHFRRGQRTNMPPGKTTVHPVSGVLWRQGRASTGPPSCTTDLGKNVVLAGWLDLLRKRSQGGRQRNLKGQANCWITH